MFQAEGVTHKVWRGIQWEVQIPGEGDRKQNSG